MNPDNRVSNEELEEWMKGFLSKSGITDYTIHFEGTAEVGDNYMSDITFIRIESRKNGTKSTKRYVVKCSKKSEELRKMIPIKKAFDNEIFVYETLMPFFKKFQTDKNVTIPFDNIPNLFGTLTIPNMEVIALENLKQDGYILWDRKKPMPLDHIYEIVRVYGRLHALSFALRDQKLDVFMKLGEHCVNIMKEFAARNQDKSFQDELFKNMLDIAEEIQDTECIKKIQLLPEKMDQLSQDIDQTDPQMVLIHGDCWNNNFMIKYEDEERKQLAKVSLLDWQICRFGPPVFDLSYFLFTCISDRDLDSFDDLNKSYYESLTKNGKELGSDIEKLFSYEDLMNQWKQYGFFGLIMMSSILRLCLSDKDEIPDVIETAAKGNLKDLFYNVKNQSEYGKRTLAAIRLASKKGIL